MKTLRVTALVATSIILRALIDKEVFERKGKFEGDALKAAFEELTRIYHAENAHSMPIKPPQIR